MTQRSYDQYCGLARALDQVGDRWAMLIVRNLLLGPQRFGQLRQGLPGIASNLLSSRLKSLQACGVIAQEGDLYALTPRGGALEPALFALSAWGESLLPEVPGPADHMLVRYAMTSLRRKVAPVATMKRVSVWIGEHEEGYTIRCGPEPEVFQGTWPEADLKVRMSVGSFRDFFFRHAEPIAWLGREGVALEGGLGALEVLRASFPGENSAQGK